MFFINNLLNRYESCLQNFSCLLRLQNEFEHSPQSKLVPSNTSKTSQISGGVACRELILNFPYTDKKISIFCEKRNPESCLAIATRSGDMTVKSLT